MNPGFWMSYVRQSIARGGTRTLLALSCIAVGVTSVVALQVASLTVQNALTSNVRAANGGDISVSTQAAPLSGTDLAVFRRLEGRGQIASWTAVSTLHGTAVGTSRRLVPFDIEVVEAPPYPLGGEPTFVSPPNGHVDALLRRHGDVLVSTVLAGELGVGAGSRLLVNTVGGHGLHAVVNGVLSETSFQHAAVMTVDRRDAVTLNDRAPHYSGVFVNVHGSPQAVAGVLRADFPAASVQTVTEALQADEAQVLDFRQFLLMVGLLALLIAGVGTLNAMQSMLVRRRLEIAMLKALGFGRASLYALFGTEAVLLGLVGGVLGTIVGVLVSKLITDTLASALGIQVMFVFDGTIVVSGVVLGVGVTLVFALLPIVRAADYRPLELLREGGAVHPLTQLPQTAALLVAVMLLFASVAALTLDDVGLAVRLVVIAFIITAVLTGAFSVAVEGLGRLSPPASRVAAVVVLVGLLAVTIILTIRVPALAAIVALATLLWVLTIVLPPDRRLPLVVALRSLSRRRSRTAVTLVAFLGGVLAMALTLSVAISLRGQINSALASMESTNLVAIGTSRGGATLLRAARGLPGIRNHSLLTVVQTEPTAINGQPLASTIGPSPAGPSTDPDGDRARQLGGITGYDLRAGAGPAGIDIVVGRGLGRGDARTGHVLLRSSLLDPPYSLHLGDTITLRDSGTGTSRAVTVVGFYTRSRRIRGFGSFFTPPIYADRSLAAAVGGSDAQAVVTFSVDPNHLTNDAALLQRRAPGALVVDIGDLAVVVDQILTELLDVLAVLTGLLLAAGLAVVANGVGLAMMERRREIALYKAIGFGPESVLRFVLIENAVLGALAGATAVIAVAIALGLLSHFALQQAIGFDPGVAAIVLVGAAALAVLIAYFAARSPVRLRPLEALRNE